MNLTRANFKPHFQDAHHDLMEETVIKDSAFGHENMLENTNQSFSGLTQVV